jgi:hypothetical protein
MTGETYPYKQYGKPTPATYHFAKDLLVAQAKVLTGSAESKVYEPSMYVPIPLDDIPYKLNILFFFLDIWLEVGTLSASLYTA